jgi:hypothetical protein
MFISNLPGDASEESVRELFSDFGVVRSVSISSDIFTGKCRGFGTVARPLAISRYGCASKIPICGVDAVVVNEAAIGIAEKTQVPLVVTMRARNYLLRRTYFQ